MNPRRSGKRKTFRSKSRRSKKLPRAIGLLAIIVVVIAAFYVFGMNRAPAGNKVLLQTNMGDITIQL